MLWLFLPTLSPPIRLYYKNPTGVSIFATALQAIFYYSNNSLSSTFQHHKGRTTSGNSVSGCLDSYYCTNNFPHTSIVFTGSFLRFTFLATEILVALRLSPPLSRTMARRLGGNVTMIVLSLHGRNGIPCLAGYFLLGKVFLGTVFRSGGLSSS